MGLTTAQIVRSRINDMPRWENEFQVGDGSASVFKLKQGSPHSTISASTFTAWVPGAGWTATGGTLEPTAGLFSFSGVISANSAVQFSYYWTVFSEDEMAYFTGLGGVPEACLGAVNHLLVNYAKRASWAAPDGSTHNDTQALASLMQIRSALVAEIRGGELGPQGGVNSWSETQQDYF